MLTAPELVLSQVGGTGPGQRMVNAASRSTEVNQIFSVLLNIFIKQHFTWQLAPGKYSFSKGDTSFEVLFMVALPDY